MKEIDKEKVIQGLEHCQQYGSLCGLDCTGFYAYMDESGKILRASEHKSNCPYRNCETGCVVTLIKDAVTLLKEKEAKSPVIREKNGYWDYYCPTCGGRDEELFREWNYCPFCGQEVKWE